MGKNHFWVGYDRAGSIIEIKVKDGSSEGLIEKWSFAIKDKQTGKKVMRILREKYGFAPEVPSEKSVNALSKEKDLDWLGD